MNCTLSEHLFALSFGSFVALSLVGGWQGVSLVTVLRLRHPATWNCLGRPEGTSNSEDVGNALSMTKFLWRREYLALGDAQLSVACDRVRRIVLLSFLSFAVLMGCIPSLGHLLDGLARSLVELAAVARP